MDLKCTSSAKSESMRRFLPLWEMWRRKLVVTADTSLTLIAFTTNSYRMCTAVTVVTSYQSVSFPVITQIAYSLGMRIDQASNTRCWSTHMGRVCSASLMLACVPYMSLSPIFTIMSLWRFSRSSIFSSITACL